MLTYMMFCLKACSRQAERRVKQQSKVWSLDVKQQ